MMRFRVREPFAKSMADLGSGRIETLSAEEWNPSSFQIRPRTVYTSGRRLTETKIRMLVAADETLATRGSLLKLVRKSWRGIMFALTAVGIGVAIAVI